ncbi:SMP-30/gluconolactonase/LRE family protein [soil metagenome]
MDEVSPGGSGVEDASKKARTRIRPVVWQPPAATARARRRASEPPAVVTVIGLPGNGSEDVLIDTDGSVLTGLADGRILRVAADGGCITEVARTGGRPLGCEFHPEGGLVVCDAERGVLRVWPETAEVQVLVGAIDGVPMKFCNNAAVARDSTIYFTDSSTRFGVEDYKGDLLEHGDTGRLLRRDPDGTVTVLLSGLHFPNGVALSADESFLVFAQTASYSVERLWLTGDSAGVREQFIDNLPAFPDNVSLGSDGLFWVALPSTRNRLLDVLSSRAPLLRSAAWALPEVLQPKEARTVFTQAFDGTGALVHDLQQPNDTFYMCSGVRERDGVVWLGSLVCPGVGRITL